jgi:hypothetical protein
MNIPLIPDACQQAARDLPTRLTRFERFTQFDPMKPRFTRHEDPRSVDGKNWAIPKLGDQGRLQFRGEAFNAFNTPQFGRPNSLAYAGLDSVVPDAQRVGEIRSLRTPMRIFQVALKLYF